MFLAQRFPIIRSLFTLLFSVSVIAQSGGDFAVTQAVVAPGGGSSTAGEAFGLVSTVGQPVVGRSSSVSPFSFDVQGGFWSQNFAPTAAGVSIRGRAMTSDNRGIPNARLVLIRPDGSRRSATTSAFGYYVFEGVETGQTYVLEISSRRFTFAEPVRIFILHDELTDLDFIAEPF